MKRKYEKSKFIKTLEEAPFVSYAAKKAGIARATIYRWQKENPEFRLAMEKALNSGRDQLIDIAEMALIDKIKSKDLGAIKFFLQHNNEKYRPVRTTYVPPNQASGVEHCPSCKQDKAMKTMPPGLARQMLIDNLRSVGLKVEDEDEGVIDWSVDPPKFVE